MQTFVPFPSLTMSASVLDYRRLGKQRVETFQILRANLNISDGWKNHPASRMWLGHEAGLIAYGVAICEEWISRGYKDTCLGKILDLGQADENDMPFWWGDDAIHGSHRSALLRKAPDFYQQYEWQDDPSVEYVWPVVELTK